MTREKTKDAAPELIALLRWVLLAPVPEETLLDLGRSFDTDDVLSGAATFTASAAQIFAALTSDQRGLLVGFTSPVLDLINAEAQILRTVKVQHDSITGTGSVSRARLRTMAREASSLGVAARDQAVALLRRVHIGDAPGLAAIEATVGTAETAHKLSAGLRGLAGIARSKLKAATEQERTVYSLLQFDTALADRLERTAAEVKATGDAEAAPLPDDRVTQRALDVQDGHVLYLVKLAHDAFRHARNHDGTILLPDLGNVQRLHDTRSHNKAAPVVNDPPATPT